LKASTTAKVAKPNVGFNEQTGQFHIEIKGLAEPKSKEAARICTEDLNEVIAAFVQDRSAIERGLFDEELVPEELTQVRMGKIIKEKYPELDEEDQEAVRQHAIAALNITQQAKQIALGGDGAWLGVPSAPRLTACRASGEPPDARERSKLGRAAHRPRLRMCAAIEPTCAGGRRGTPGTKASDRGLKDAERPRWSGLAANRRLC
jgi:hypothetical protein